MFKQPDQKPNFSDLELALQQWWKDKKIYEKSVEIRNGAKDYIFYDGPPFMSGMPHYATLLSSLPKDIIPRYQTMQGKRVERLWGWDCHGLPIENKVEEQLGLNGRKQILEHGLEDFIAKCYEWNRVGIDNWRWYIDKIGRWADLDNAYRTMDQDYMESVWWAFKEMWDKGLVYKGKRTSLFSTDSSTPVSNFEVTMDPDNYRDTEDTAVAVKFKLTSDSLAKLNSQLGKEFSSAYFLSWTTTPWTLPSNFALALKPDAIYSVVIQNNEAFILIKSRLESYFGTDVESVEVNSNDLAGMAYNQLYSFLNGNEKDFHVYLSEHVSDEEGTGVLHIAPAFGEVDFEIGQTNGLSDLADIDDAGKMTVGPWEGTYIRKANDIIAEDLKANGALFKAEKYTHRLPYYRYKNPLIYKTQENYFLNVQSIKQDLITSNEAINWVPDYFKEGRFKYVLETAPDWSISRSRFWGTVMPIWQSSTGKQVIIGSRDELMSAVNATPDIAHIRKVTLRLAQAKAQTVEDFRRLVNGKEDAFTFAADQTTLSQVRNQFFAETEAESQAKPIQTERAYYLVGDKPLDMHRPFIDSIKFVVDGEEYTRIPETLDVWMDSGSMPFAQFHYPFENKQKFERSFPGDFIAEYTGQIRAWFYVLHVISNSLFESNAFKNVLVTGVMAGTDGRKMSKSFKNYPDPKDTLIKYGGDALRMYLLGSPVMMGNDINFSEEDIRMQIQEFILPLWNCFSYLTTYANMHNWEPRTELAYNKRNVWGGDHPWDHISFTDIDNELDAWIITTLQNTIGEVTAGLDSYDIPRASRSLKQFVNELSKWYIRRSRDRFASGDIQAIETLYYVLVEFIKLAAPFVPFITEKIYQSLVADQLTEMPESVHLTDYPVVDPAFLTQYATIVPEMNLVRDISEIGQAIRTTNSLKVRQPLPRLEVQLSLKDDRAGLTLTPWMLNTIGAELNVLEVEEVPKLAKSDTTKTGENTTLGITIGLETKLTPELEVAGVVREVIRAIQALRKAQGLQMGETANVTYSTDAPELAKIMEANSAEIMRAVSASVLVAGEAEVAQQINGKELRLTLVKSA